MPTLSPEILAPVADMEMCRAAVRNGADAIYLGFPGFNARGRAQTLSLEELKDMMDFCHLYGVKVFIACNVLIFEGELAELSSKLREVIELGPDAFLVQDLGLVRLIRQIAPDLEVHASTQMTITNAEAIELTGELGIKRFVLGRELSITEMKRVREKTSAELEVFVHGALCVSYSGQCLTSESIGGRSANRGQCAQSCRWPHELYVDGKHKDMGERRYLVSPQDLCSIDDVPRLIEAGIDSFKIEGRLKSAEYVASTVRSYFEAIHEKLDNQSVRTAELQTIYSRGFFNGWMDGVNHQRLVDGRFPNNHGLEIGKVVSVSNRGVELESSVQIALGDGLVFADFENEIELGSNVYQVEQTSQYLRVELDRKFELKQLRPGMIVFKNSSPKLVSKWRQSFADKQLLKRVPIDLALCGEPGNKLSVTVSDGVRTVTVQSEGVLAVAKKSPLDNELIRDELGALSETPFRLRNLKIDFSAPVFIHQRELKELRRSFVKILSEQRTFKTVEIAAVSKVDRWLTEQTRSLTEEFVEAAKPSLAVLVREREQLEALEGLNIETVYLDYEFGKLYEESIATVRSLGFKAGIATTRILKPGELGHLNYINRLKPDLVLVRNLGAIQYFQGGSIPLVGDFSLNVTNSLTAAWLLSKGLARLCASYDLNQPQLFELAETIGGAELEVTLHQYMPAFHMEHCVFAAFLSNGTSYRDCGRPCERHRVELKDPSGALHPLRADAECRNTMFNGTPQSAARLVPGLLERGVRAFRLEALYETAPKLRSKIESYLSLLRGELESSELFPRLGVLEKYGVSEGQLYKVRAYKDRKQSRGAET